MPYTKESRITTIDDVKEFFAHLVNERRLVFHPDDRFEDYVSDDGREAFSEEECAIYNRLMDESFEVCEKNNADIYAIGLEVTQSL
jgi:phenylalanine-4-hydroxylase